MINNIFVHNFCSHWLIALFPQNKLLEIELLGERVYGYIQTRTSHIDVTFFYTICFI